MNISIIIPTYNSSQVIQECIESIKNQKYDGIYEIIIVDNGSDDDTLQKVKNMGIEKIIISPNTTVYGSRNIGVMNSVGDILVFLDSDCVASNEWLSSGVKQLKECDLVAGKIIPRKNKNTLLYYYDKYILCQGRERDKKNINIAAGNAFIKREVLENLNGFRDDIATAGDSIFSMMARKKGYKIKFSENAIVSHPVDPIGRKIRGLFREGAGAQIKGPYQYNNQKIAVKIKKRIQNLIKQYTDDLLSILEGFKKRDINIILFIKLVVFALFMRTIMYFSIIIYIYIKPLSKLLSRR